VSASIQKAFALLLVTAAAVGLIAFSVRITTPGPKVRATPCLAENATFIPELTAPPAPPMPPPAPPPRTVVGYTTQIIERFTVTPRVTCYSQYDGEVESKGLYASWWNEIHEDLPVSERTIQQYHYTAAMPEEYRRYHEELNRLPNGTHYFRWLIHIPGYNGEDKDGPDAWRYYSVPRDTCPQPGRVDVLFTGSKPHVLDEQKLWKEKPTHLPCTFYEVVPVAVYSDGTAEVWVP